MRLALAPINPTVGDIAGNAALLERHIAQLMAGAPSENGGRPSERPDLIAFPELATCGYPPKDLLAQEGFVERCVDAVAAIGTKLSKNVTLVIGTPTRHAITSDAPVPTADRGVANSLLVYRDGSLIAQYDKRLLPTYDVFDEDRYFRPGHRAVVIDVPCRDTPGSSMRVGLTICEDLWKGEDAGFSARYANAGDPVAETVALGAQVILSPSASPFVLGKGARHETILRGHAKRHGVWVASINQLGGNDELVFDGHTMVYAPTGDLVAAGENFTGEPLACDLRPNAARKPAVPPSARPDEAHLWHSLVLGVRDYCRKTGFKRALLGLSGGIDSALTAAIAVAALGAPNLIGVLMPAKYSSDHSIADAQDLARRLGLVPVNIPIEAAVQGMRTSIDSGLGALAQPGLGSITPDLADENLQSRVRGTVVMSLSNRTGAIVLTTGNKSELAVGYCTLYGDMNGGLAVLSDVTKHWVYRLSRWCNEHWRALGIDNLTGPPIPESSISKAPSAELRPNQTDQDSLPPYDTIDQVVRRYVEGRQSPPTIARESGIDQAIVERVVRMIDQSEYKRKQAAIGLKVTSVAFGSGRRWPIAQRWRG